MTAFANLPLTGLVGRDREIGILHDALAAALAGRGGLVLIGGEAGIGKTALAEAVCQEAREQGALILSGHCYDLTETPPYGPWIDLFARFEPLMTPALPEAFAQRGTVGAVPNQMTLFAQVQDFLRALTGHQPVALLLDDMHWADPASLDLLRFLSHSLSALPLLLIVMYRSDELTRRHPLYQMLPQLAREASARRLDLRALDNVAIRALVDAGYGLTDTDAGRLVSYLQSRSEGNALFVGELLRTLEERGELVHDGDPWRLGDLAQTGVPALLQNVIDARVSRLDEDAQRLLAIAAVIGYEIPLDVWTAVGEATEDQILAATEQGLEARLLAETGDAVRFTHALIREALYEGLASVRRRRIHRRIAEALTEHGIRDPDAVAYHFQRAHDPRALPWLIEAGERAQRAYARLTAAERFEEALALMEVQGADAGERGWMLLRLGLLRRYDDPRKALTFLAGAEAAAAQAGDALLAACARCDHGLVRCFVGDKRAGVRLIAEAVDALDALPPLDATVRERVERMGIATNPEHHRSLLALWLGFSGELRRAQALAERVVARMPPTAMVTLDGAFAPDAYLALGNIYALMGRAIDAQQAYAHSRAAYEEIGDLLQVKNTLQSVLYETVLPYQANDPRARRRLAAEIVAYETRAATATASRYPPEAWTLPALALDGRWEEVRGVLTALQDDWEAAWLIAPFAHAIGEEPLARDLLQRTFPNGPPTTLDSDLRFIDELALIRLGATLAIDAQDLPVARAWLEIHDRRLAWSGSVLGQSEGQALWAKYYRHAGDRDAGYARAESALAHASAPRQPLALLAVHRLLGELGTEVGRYDDAARHLDESLRLADACQAPYDRALTLLALAELHGAQGETDQARTLLDEVQTICTRLGAQPALARADVLAARIDTLKHVPPVYPAGLSAREVEVLRLLTGGKTNREIADALFLSEHTVRVHVRNILTKTETENRTAAAIFARDHSLA